MFVSGIILAAGKSQRFGRKPKLITDLNGKPLLMHSVNAALSSDIREIIVVTGPETKEKIDFPEGLNIIVNNDQELGMSHSINLGISQISKDADAFMILLGDMPNISSKLISMLIEKFKGNRNSIITSSLKGKTMPPVLFPSSYRDILKELTGDRGARDLIKSEDNVIRLELSDSELADVDTESALK